MSKWRCSNDYSTAAEQTYCNRATRLAGMEWTISIRAWRASRSVLAMFSNDSELKLKFDLKKNRFSMYEVRPI